MKKIMGPVRSGLFSLILSLCAGCSDSSENPPPDPYPDMPPVLKSLQGAWSTLQTNESCSVLFQGYTVRLRYENDEDGIQHKQNASIDRVDTDRSYLIINGGSGAWSYRFDPADQQQLYLEFLTEAGWRRIHFTRSEI